MTSHGRKCAESGTVNRVRWSDRWKVREGVPGKGTSEQSPAGVALQTFEGKGIQTRETACKSPAAGTQAWWTPGHTAGDTLVSSRSQAPCTPPILTSELEDPSDTQRSRHGGHGRPGGSGLPGHPWSTSLKFQLEAVISGNGRTHTGTRPGAGKDTEALREASPEAQPGRPAGTAGQVDLAGLRPSACHLTTPSDQICKWPSGPQGSIAEQPYLGPAPATRASALPSLTPRASGQGGKPAPGSTQTRRGREGTRPAPSAGRGWAGTGR